MAVVAEALLHKLIDILTRCENDGLTFLFNGLTPAGNRRTPASQF